ncbi:Sir2 family NAD-dependent protein deacetylase [Demequina zhanjiangensis]|uniref:protein acetyllysine N-acetyltransferase n=1 Tax=Demequina zhanjiangensis TaxID=3051659 RepID=A0ABT8G2T1_9MICO|nr:Sir2 family NAD-dependent protein deacetylase [Demequina sp. SYSU T00b26]MDN4473459.1 Sir2 family NAD-dependent protein deacetylase [Demequina sp. SYSU T00b26]
MTIEDTELPEQTEALARALDLLAERTIAALTGAGLSTDSGIPDYRGANSPRRTPMTVHDFVGDEAMRRRYWVGSHLGWKAFAATQPNPGHAALAALEDASIVTGLVTQNVDGLHLRAGSQRVVELHGNMRTVTCLVCGTQFSRHDIAERLERDNPVLAVPEEVELGPDGDVLPSTWQTLTVPDCTVCGGTLKPDVVFFGEYVPKPQTYAAEAIVDEADALLVAGSSLAVNSGVRLVERAHRRGVPIVIINRGPTKGDRRAAVKIDAGTSETLDALAAALTQSGR